MTTGEAKQIIAEKLVDLDLPSYRLTAHTVGFSDLMRGDCIFVEIHGWKPDPLWADLKAAAHKNDFCLEPK